MHISRLHLALVALLTIAGCAVPEEADMAVPRKRSGNGAERKADGTDDDGGVDEDADVDDGGADGGVDPDGSAPDPDPTGPWVLFINMDTVTLRCGSDHNSRTNTVAGRMCSYAGSHAAMNGTGLCGFWTSFADCKEDIRKRVAELFNRWDIEVVTSRPPANTNYMMIVVDGGDGEAPSGERGDAPLSCTGDPLPNSIGIVFANQIYWDATWSWACAVSSAAALAVMISHEAGHLLGLYNVTSGNSSIMSTNGDRCSQSWGCPSQITPNRLPGCTVDPASDVLCATQHLNRVAGR